MSSTAEKLAHWATVTAVVVAGLGFWSGGKQFGKAQAAASEAQAVELFIKYNEIMRELPGSDPTRWVHNQGIALAESIFILKPADESWIETVKFMLEENRASMSSLNCLTYSDQFIALASKHGYECLQGTRRDSAKARN
jgi:hypothetical protein